MVFNVKHIIIIMLMSICVITQTFADSNGIWNYAEDVTPGTFGLDELNLSQGFVFINKVLFNDSVTLDYVKGCGGVLGTDIVGKISCVPNNDFNDSNEIQNLNEVLLEGNDAGGQVIKNLGNPVGPQDAATKTYVDTVVAAATPSMNPYWDYTGTCPSGFTKIKTASYGACGWYAGTAGYAWERPPGAGCDGVNEFGTPVDATSFTIGNAALCSPISGGGCYWDYSNSCPSGFTKTSTGSYGACGWYAGTAGYAWAKPPGAGCDGVNEFGTPVDATSFTIGNAGFCCK